ncbi:hypothetical protein AKJ16_DCAP21246 [Drosera capensis]
MTHSGPIGLFSRLRLPESLSLRTTTPQLRRPSKVPTILTSQPTTAFSAIHTKTAAPKTSPATATGPRRQHHLQPAGSRSSAAARFGQNTSGLNGNRNIRRLYWCTLLLPSSISSISHLHDEVQQHYQAFKNVHAHNDASFGALMRQLHCIHNQQGGRKEDQQQLPPPHHFLPPQRIAEDDEGC